MSASGSSVWNTEMPACPRAGPLRQFAYAGDRWAWRADRIGFLWVAAPLGGAGFFALFAIGQMTRAQAWRGHADWAGNALIGVTAAQSLSLPLWMLLTHKGLSNERLQPLSYGLLIAAMAILGLGRGAAADMAGLVLAGAAYSAMNMAVWALVAMHGHADMFRRLGLSATPVGLFVGVLKGFTGLGTLLSSAMLTWAIRAAPRP